MWKGDDPMRTTSSPSPAFVSLALISTSSSYSEHLRLLPMAPLTRQSCVAVQHCHYGGEGPEAKHKKSCPLLKKHKGMGGSEIIYTVPSVGLPSVRAYSYLSRVKVMMITKRAPAPALHKKTLLFAHAQEHKGTQYIPKGSRNTYLCTCTHV